MSQINHLLQGSSAPHELEDGATRREWLEMGLGDDGLVIEVAVGPVDGPKTPFLDHLLLSWEALDNIIARYRPKVR